VLPEEHWLRLRSRQRNCGRTPASDTYIDFDYIDFDYIDFDYIDFDYINSYYYQS